MLNLEDALLKIKENPLKYIGGKSLERLNHFMLGYTLGQIERNVELQEFLHQFQVFIQKKYNILISQSFADIIRFYSTSDEHAYNEFYELLEEFYKER